MKYVKCPTCFAENIGSQLLCAQCGSTLVGAPRYDREDPAPPAIQESLPPTIPVDYAKPQDESFIRQQELYNINHRLKNGAAWFFWIAGLSVINSGIAFFGNNTRFIMGLGITQIVDAIAGILARDLPEIRTVIFIVAIGLDILVVGLFILLGYFARKGIRWIFILGMVLYFLDGLIFLLVGDILSTLFHLWALYGLFTGLKACIDRNKLTKTEEQAVPALI